VKPTAKKQISKAIIVRRRLLKAIKDDPLIRPWGRKDALAIMLALSTPVRVPPDQTAPLDAPISRGSKSKDVTAFEAAAAFGRYQLLKDTIGEADAVLRYRADRQVALGTIRKAVRDKRLVVLRGEDGELRFPRWQFHRKGGVIPGLREVITSLPPWIIKDDVSVAVFFLNPNPLTGGQPPIQALRSGKVQAVILAATDARY